MAHDAVRTYVRTTCRAHLQGAAAAIHPSPHASLPRRTGTAAAHSAAPRGDPTPTRGAAAAPPPQGHLGGGADHVGNAPRLVGEGGDKSGHHRRQRSVRFPHPPRAGAAVATTPPSSLTLLAHARSSSVTLPLY